MPATATVAPKTGKTNGHSAPKDEDVILVRPLHIERIEVEIVGRTPLLVNRFSEEAAGKLETSQGVDGRIKASKQPRNPEAEFIASRYLIGEPNKDYKLDVCGFPASGIKKAMVSAGGRVTDTQMTWLRAVLNVDADLIEIEGPAPTMRADHVVRVGRGNLCYRAQFWPWTMHVPISFNADQLKASDVANLLQQAGFSIGIGDWRPEKNGSFGTFEVGAASK